MLRKRTFVMAGAILACCASLEAAITVGYYTDGADNNGTSQTPDQGLAAPILANGFTPIQILDITAFVAAGNLKDLTKISILMIDEVNVSRRPPTQALLDQTAALSAWVALGGVIAIHDRNVCQGTCTPAARASPSRRAGSRD